MPQRIKFVEAVVKATGATQVIPARWLDNPEIAAGFVRAKKSTRAPSAQSAEVSAEATSTQEEN